MDLKIIAAAIIALQIMITIGALGKVFVRRPLKLMIPQTIERDLFRAMAPDASRHYLGRGTMSAYELTREVEKLLSTSLAAEPQSNLVKFRYALMSLKRMYVQKFMIVVSTAVLSIGAWVYIGLNF